MKKYVIIFGLVGIAIAFLIGILSQKEVELTEIMELKEKYSKKHIPSVDHTKFSILKAKFTSPQQVTYACISCHNKTADEVMQCNHWNWEEPIYMKGRGVVYLGKKNAINNFCLGTEGNELACAKCHIGYGMESSRTFNYQDSTNIDCLICHDNTETYAKAQEKGGAPDPTLDFSNISQNVGKPKRSNCGVCHFYGGGGNNVKHGDLEKAMFEPSKSVDIHMGTEGMNLQCVDCHKTERHNIKGQLYSLASTNRNRVFCEDCHENTPHKNDILNEHMPKISCQTCHIPIYAKVNATKTYWDWSTAGKLKNGEPYHEEDADGNHTYLSTKGSFKWGKNLKPDYVWFDGTADHYLIGDKIIDTTVPLVLNKLHGSYSNPNAKIIPVKIMTTKQCFDPIYSILSLPLLFDPKVGVGAFWKDFDCLRALEVGMAELGLPFSNTLDFIDTKMYWPVNHMVSRKEESVQCIECHTRYNGRLAGLKDFYMPGRDRSVIVDTAGTWLIVLSLLGIISHATIRVVAKRKRRGGK